MLQYKCRKPHDYLQSNNTTVVTNSLTRKLLDPNRYVLIVPCSSNQTHRHSMLRLYVSSSTISFTITANRSPNLALLCLQAFQCHTQSQNILFTLRTYFPITAPCSIFMHTSAVTDHLMYLQQYSSMSLSETRNTASSLVRYKRCSKHNTLTEHKRQTASKQSSHAT